MHRLSALETSDFMHLIFDVYLCPVSILSEFDRRLLSKLFFGSPFLVHSASRTRASPTKRAKHSRGSEARLVLNEEKIINLYMPI